MLKHLSSYIVVRMPKWILTTLLQIYRMIEPIEKQIVFLKGVILRWTPSFMIYMVHIAEDGKIQSLYQKSYINLFYPKMSWNLKGSANLFIFRCWNNKTQSVENYCLSKQQIKKAFGFTNDKTLNYLNSFEKTYLIDTLLEHTSKLEKAPVLTVIPYKKYCRHLECYKTSVMSINNLTVHQLCQLASYVAKSPQPKNEAICEATIIDEQLKEIVKKGVVSLF